MDLRSLEALDFEEIRSRLSSFTRSKASKKHCEEMHPWATYEDIQEALKETHEALQFLQAQGDIPARETEDIISLVSKASIASVLTGKELLQITGYLRTFEDINSLFAGKEDLFPRLTTIVQLVPNCHETIHDVEKLLETDGSVKSDASVELTKIRKQIASTLHKIESTYEKLLNSPTYGKMFQDDIITKMNDRYVILLKTQYRNQFPCRVMGRSDSGESLYVEHMDVVGLNNDYYMYQQLEQKEIEKILSHLTQKIGEKASSIQKGIRQIHKLDFIFAKAKLSRQWNGVLPRTSKKPLLDLHDARHPLLEVSNVVPISFHLGKDFRSMIITGPNTGGKTVTLKTAGLFVALTYCGFLIPASSESTIGWFTDVLADIGEEQSIQQSLSTFSAHLTRLIEIVKKAHPTTLLLIDELGSGTDPEEGAALGMALLESLHREKIPMMVSTHLPLIKSFAYEYEEAMNASVGFDIASLAPTYKLYIGSPGASQAFEIAKRLGIEKDLLEIAAKYLDTKATYTRKLMNNMHRKKEEIDDTLSQTKELQKTIQQQKEHYEAEISKIETNYKGKFEKDRMRFQTQMQDYMEKAKDVLSQLSRQQKHSREAEDLMQVMNALQGKVSNTKPEADFTSAPPDETQEEALLESDEYTTQPVERARDINIGDFVFIPSIQKEALVIKKIPQKKKVEVQYGQWRQTLPYSDIQLITKEEDSTPEIEVDMQSVEIPTSDTSERCDVHGFHVEEALPVLDQFLDKAYMAKLPQVYIVHGSGTGALREAVQEFAKKHPHTKSITPGEKTTIVYLR